MGYAEYIMLIISFLFVIWTIWSDEMQPAITKLLLGIAFLIGALCVNVST